MPPNQQSSHAIWAIVPAAGIGRRMQSAVPKQYLLLNDSPVLKLTLDALLQNANISGLVIALQADDQYWPGIKLHSSKPVIQAKGGKERADSVLNALDALFDHEGFNPETDWVMVHDAVRPCLSQTDINRLVSEVADNADGGLLAIPVRDTKKRQHPDRQSVETTVVREFLWRALTPQYFPASSLKKALQQALDRGDTITDESSAMELAGFSPMLVEGFEDNIKITRPADLALAGLYLRYQERIHEQ